jgi:hypothetical protein
VVHAVTEDDELRAQFRHLYDDDGNLIEPLVLAELHDYTHLIRQSMQVYDALTNSRLSAPHHYADNVISAATDYTEEIIRESVLSALDRIEQGEHISDVRRDYTDD